MGAYVDALDQLQTQDGSTPAFLATSALVHYQQVVPGTWTLENSSNLVTVAGYAAVTPQASASNLLEIWSYGSSANPGNPVGVISPDPDIREEAGWSNVEATVRGADGNAPPSAIRLEFQINYTPLDQLALPSLAPGSSLNARSLYLDGAYGFSIPLDTNGAGSLLQQGEPTVKLMPDGLLRGMVHIDLPLSAAGVSNPFSVGISSQLPSMLNGRNVTNLDQVSLSLVGITLPDGTPLEAKGYSVSFESGVISPPTQTPEPATLAIWGLTAVCAGLIHYRRFPGR